jgi:hypothetical protein
MDRKFTLLILSIFITLGVFGLMIVLLLLSGPGRPNLIPKEYTELVNILPGLIYTDISLLFAIPIGLFGLIYVATPLFSKILVGTHKIIMRGASYGFAELGRQLKGRSFLLRAFMVSISAFNLSAFLVGVGYGSYFRAGVPLSGVEVLFETEAVFLATYLLAPVGLIIFVPLWILEDTGVVMWRIFPDQRRIPDVQGVHAIYMNIWKTFISFSTLSTLWQFISRDISYLSSNGGFSNPAILTPFIMCVLPFITIGLVAIPTYLYEKYLPRFKASVRRGLASFNLPDIKIPDIQQIGIDRITVD